MPKIELEEYILDSDEGGAPDLQRWVEHRGLKDFRVFVSTHKKTGSKTYLLVEGENAVYESQQSEAVAVFIDTVWLSRKKG